MTIGSIDSIAPSKVDDLRMRMAKAHGWRWAAVPHWYYDQYDEFRELPNLSFWFRKCVIELLRKGQKMRCYKLSGDNPEAFRVGNHAAVHSPDVAVCEAWLASCAQKEIVND